MNNIKNFIFLFISFFTLLFSSCKKSTTTNNDVIVPTNIALNAMVSTDNSGNVIFTATANNSVSFEYDFGNGIFQTVVSGVVTYKYLASGTYTVNVIAKSSSGQTVSKSITITVNVLLSLVWSEEFNTAGAPDASKWGYDLGAGGWGNNELENYTDRVDNVSVSGGTLKITAKREAYNGSAFTSARILTKNKFSFRYGKLEARAKLPAGGGTWPAIWMLGNNSNTVAWPGCGEIDIMEHVGNQLNKIFSTLHSPGHSGANGDGGTTVITNATSEFHKYGMEWSATAIKFFVDDVPFYTFTNSAATPFNLNFFIILNVAMGGNFGGTVDPAFTSAAMEIDYIRVYQ